MENNNFIIRGYGFSVLLKCLTYRLKALSKVERELSDLDKCSQDVITEQSIIERLIYLLTSGNTKEIEIRKLAEKKE